MPGASSRVRGHLEVELFDWLKCFGFLFASQDAGQKRAQLQIESEGRRSAVTYSKTTLCAPDQCSLDGQRRRTRSPLHVSPPLLNGSNDVQWRRLRLCKRLWKYLRLSTLTRLWKFRCKNRLEKRGSETGLGVRLRTFSSCQVQVPVAVKSVKHVEVLQMEYQDEDVHVPVPQISRYKVYKLLKVRHNFHHWKISKVSDVDDMMICNFSSSRKTLKDFHRRIVQMHCAWLLDTDWIRILCKIHIIFGRRVVPSNGQGSLFWVPELHFRKVQTQRHVPMVSVVKRHVEAHSTRGLGVGRVGPGQRSFEFKHDAAYSLRYSLLCACTHFHIAAAGNCIFREHPNLVSDYQISTRRW